MKTSREEGCREDVVLGADEFIGVDTHEWVEIFNDGKMQTLRCAKCGKESSGTLTQSS